jgi:DNA invertase Pin-like site-specific DNA recombinase
VCESPERADRRGVARRVADIGADEDSGHRRRATGEAFAAGADYLIIGGHHGAAVFGSNLVERYLDLAVMLDYVEADHVRVASVEDASRSARSPMAREIGVLLMRRRGVEVVCAGSDNLTATNEASRVEMRLADAFAEYEKARLVQNLRGARSAMGTARGDAARIGFSANGGSVRTWAAARFVARAVTPGAGRGACSSRTS